VLGLRLHPRGIGSLPGIMTKPPATATWGSPAIHAARPLASQPFRVAPPEATSRIPTCLPYFCSQAVRASRFAILRPSGDGRPAARRGRGSATIFGKAIRNPERTTPWERQPAPSGGTALPYSCQRIKKALSANAGIVWVAPPFLEEGTLVSRTRVYLWANSWRGAIPTGLSVRFRAPRIPLPRLLSPCEGYSAIPSRSYVSSGTRNPWPTQA